MNKYLDYKVTTWIRVKFPDDVDLQQVIKDIEEGELPPNFKIDETLDFEQMLETEEFMHPVENDGQSTIEIYENDKCIWDNSFESELKRKEK